MPGESPTGMSSPTTFCSINTITSSCQISDLPGLRETIGFANISDGSIMGTPAYMSPEQIQGDQEIDGRSDIYSLGVVLFQMLSGSVPFFGTTAASVMMMHLVNPVPQIYDKNNTLPVAIQAVLETAMAKKPEDRYQSAAEFAKAIQTVTTGVHRKPAYQSTAPVINRRQGSNHTPVTPAQIPVESANQVNKPAATQSKPKHNQTPSSGSNPALQKPAAQTPDKARTLPEGSPVPSALHPSPLLQRKLFLPVWGWIISAAVLLVITLVLILWSQGIFPFAASFRIHRQSQGSDYP